MTALAAALTAEQERRRAARQQAAEKDRAWLLDTLDRIHERLAQTPDYVHERLTGAPGYIAPTGEEEKRMIATLEARFREIGYDITG